MDGGETLILKEKVIVANTGEDTLTCIGLRNREVTETIDLKSTINSNKDTALRLDESFIGPYDMVSSNQGFIYCTNIYNNSVFKIDIKNKKILDILCVGSFPTCIRYFKDRLFITNSDSNSISIIDEKTFSLIENIPVGEKPMDIEIDETNMEMYVANSNGYSINVIDLKGKDNKLIKLDNNPVKVILEEKSICILSIANNGMTNNSNISIIDKETYKVQESIDFEGIFSTMLKINGSEIIFITNIDNGYLYRMDIVKGDLLSKTYLNGMPNKLEWDGDNTLFISNISTNTLALFDIDTNQIIDNIKVGIEPNGILILN